ncbi:hypothetical protein [Flavobacterium sp.]|uniref:hypothetical protein n=1 Tax=Flavobacterium sp. TaxID=239 RepID=UPI002488A82D|nr:hypothetical protein [Flavobacterium sp.]MDI1316899.1 hypothetical protein [Flavobacterium sp.]
MEEIELYHITCIEYPIGVVNPIEDLSFYHSKTLTDSRSWINDFLDENSPEDFPSRKKSFYACNTIANCKALKSTICNEADCIPRIYKVRMNNPIKVPMALVTHLFKLGEDNTVNTDIANEYWTPTEEWKFYEYLSEEMEIIEEMINSDVTPMGQILFWATNSNSLLADDAAKANNTFI